MAEAQQRGGILGLCRIVRQHEDEVRFELLKVGSSLEHLFAGELGWADLRAVVRCAARESPLFRAMNSAEALLTVEQVLLTHILNVLRGMSWQLAGDGNARKPSPILLPGMAGESESQTFGSDPIPLGEFHDWWDSLT